MITLTRNVARQLRAVAGKLLGKPFFIAVQAGHDGLRIFTHSQSAALEYLEPGTFSPCSITVPFSLLKEIEGTKPQPVTLAPAADKRVTATWLDGEVPRSITVDTFEPTENDPTFPAAPANWLANDPGLLGALVDATESADTTASRYALGCLQLRGRGGVIDATDGRQLLKQSGYAFPFEDEVLIPATKVFACKALHTGDPVHVGRTETHVVFRIGPWTVYLGIQKEGRFPRIDEIIPRTDDASTIVELAKHDHQFLTANLGRLPVETEQYQEVTVELNGSVAIRAKRGEDPPTELILSNSHKTGNEISFATNRRFLQRAAELGLSRLHVYGQDRPVLCQDDHRQFLWMLLDKSGIVPSSPATTQVRSPVVASSTHAHATRIRGMPRRKSSVGPSNTPAPSSANSVPGAASSSQKATRPSTASAPIDQAVKLRTSLREALVAANELLRAIKKQKKQDRALRSTLASLRQLQAVA